MFEKLTMSEETARFFSTMASVVTALGLVVGGLYTLRQYFDARNTDSRNYGFQLKVAQTEAQKEYYSKVMSICSDFTAATGTIATPSTPKGDRQQAIQTFWRFYNGPANLMWSPDLSAAMSDFAKCLKDDCKGTVSVSNAVNSPDSYMPMLSRNIAASCRNQVIHGLNIGGLIEAPSGARAVAR